MASPPERITLTVSKTIVSSKKTDKHAGPDGLLTVTLCRRDRVRLAKLLAYMETTIIPRPTQYSMSSAASRVALTRS